MISAQWFQELQNVISLKILSGKQVSILVNLEPRKIRGIESQGMILMAEDADSSLKFVSPVDKVKNGSEVR